LRRASRAEAFGAGDCEHHRMRAARAGEAVADAEVAAMRIDGGAAGFARLAAELVSATFGGAEISQNP
jgi:hypothetical protein